MRLFIKKGSRYREATDQEIFSEGLRVMRETPRLSEIAAKIEFDMILGLIPTSRVPENADEREASR
jgi:hypothetical protein